MGNSMKMSQSKAQNKAKMIAKMKMNGAMTAALFAIIAGFCADFGSSVWAADVALVSGLYRGETVKQGGAKVSDLNEISFGGRYLDDLSKNMGWFADASLDSKSYSGGPDSSVGLEIGGGARYYFLPFAQSMVPFASADGHFKNEKNVDFMSGLPDYVQTETNGLFYGGGVGVRIGLDTQFWLELESRFFESALVATETVKRIQTVTTGTTTTTVETKSERTRTELYVSTRGAFSQLMLSVGMKL